MKQQKKIPVIFPPGSLMRPYQSEVVMDPLGSYTGVAEDPAQTPVQDADDL